MNDTMLRIFLIFIFALAGTGVAGAQDLYFPPVNSDTWETIDPADLNWNEEVLDSLIHYLDQNNTKSFMVLVDGKLVMEEYFDSFARDSVWYWASAGKGMTAFLTGVLQEEGLLSIDHPTSDYLGTGWTTAAEEQEDLITVRNQLQMTTGLDDGVNNKDCTLDSCLVYLADAGDRWAYHNAPYTLLTNVMEQATDQTINGILLSKIRFQTGITGAYIPLGFNRIMFSTPRSFARFGLLMLNRGRWDDNLILGDDEYFDQMISTSQSLNNSYGYLWWLNGKENFMVPGIQIAFDGPLVPDAPEDMYAALGLNGQIINVVPSMNLVMIRMGNNPGDDLIPLNFNNDIWKYLMSAMNPSSVEQAPPEDFSVFPNPSSGKVHIKSGPISGPYTLSVIDGNGRLLFQKENAVSLDLSPFPGGVYTLVLTDSKGIRKARVVRE